MLQQWGGAWTAGWRWWSSGSVGHGWLGPAGGRIGSQGWPGAAWICILSCNAIGRPEYCTALTNYLTRYIPIYIIYKYNLGAGIAHWLERRTRDRKVAGSNPCWSGGRILFSRVHFLCWLLFRYPFHPRVTAVARKRPRSFCQKRRWQVRAKHTYILRMWLCMNWHGAWLYGVHRTCQDWLSLAADSCGTSHASAVRTPLRWIFKNAL